MRLSCFCRLDKMKTLLYLVSKVTCFPITKERRNSLDGKAPGSSTFELLLDATLQSSMIISFSVEKYLNEKAMRYKPLEMKRDERSPL
jgi:hypothetical protein